VKTNDEMFLSEEFAGGGVFTGGAGVLAGLLQLIDKVSAISKPIFVNFIFDMFLIYQIYFFRL